MISPLLTALATDPLRFLPRPAPLPRTPPLRTLFVNGRNDSLQLLRTAAGPLSHRVRLFRRVLQDVSALSVPLRVQRRHSARSARPLASAARSSRTAPTGRMTSGRTAPVARPVSLAASAAAFFAASCGFGVRQIRYSRRHSYSARYSRSIHSRSGSRTRERSTSASSLWAETTAGTHTASNATSRSRIAALATSMACGRAAMSVHRVIAVSDSPRYRWSNTKTRSWCSSPGGRRRNRSSITWGAVGSGSPSGEGGLWGWEGCPRYKLTRPPQGAEPGHARWKGRG